MTNLERWVLGLGLLLSGLPDAMPFARRSEEAARATSPPIVPVEEADIASGLEEPIPGAPISDGGASGHEPWMARPERTAALVEGGIPERLVIPSIALDAPVVPAASRFVSIGGRRYREWLAPDRYAAGWHPLSARAGMPGNMVLSGHNNIAGAVFRRLTDVKIGDPIWIHTRDRIFRYEVTERHVLPERDQPLTVRQANARWIGPFPDERLTLVTCWPPWSNSHRLIVVARPRP